MKVFFDTEFTGLTKGTTLISIGFVSDGEESLYIELSDYERSMVSPWVSENVIKNLWYPPNRPLPSSVLPNYFRATKEQAASIVVEWMDGWDSVEMWSDCLAYDWVLFCDLFGGADKLPEKIFYIPFDLCTAFLCNGIDPDIEREKYISGVDIGFMGGANKHNALYDAAVIRECYRKMMGVQNE